MEKEDIKLLKKEVILLKKIVKTKEIIIENLNLTNETLKEQILKAQYKQEICNKICTSKTLYIIEKNDLLKNTQKRLNYITKTKSIQPSHIKEIHSISNSLKIHLSSASSEWEEFKLRFEEIHEHFTQEILKKHPELSSSQLRLCQLLRLQLSSKKIASLLNVNSKSVDRSRYELRKLFGLQKDQSLTKYLIQIKN